jgi:hypothetical protein
MQNVKGVIQRKKAVKTTSVHSITINMRDNRLEVWIDYRPITCRTVFSSMLLIMKVICLIIFRILVFIDQNMHEVYDIVKLFSGIFKH